MSLMAMVARTQVECAHCAAQPPQAGQHHRHSCPRYEVPQEHPCVCGSTRPLRPDHDNGGWLACPDCGMV